MAKINFKDFIVEADLADEGIEEGKKYFVLFELDHGQNHDLCRGIFTDLEAAIGYGKMIDNDSETLCVADYKAYTDGNWDELWVSRIKAKMVTKISKFVEGSGYEYTTEYDSRDFYYKPDSFRWEDGDDSWADELIENEPEEVDFKVWYEIVDKYGEILDKSGEFFVRN